MGYAFSLAVLKVMPDLDNVFELKVKTPEV
jgi:hypothetical protein